MKSIHVTFTDAEFKKLKRGKGKLSWHDWMVFISLLFPIQKSDNKSNGG